VDAVKVTPFGYFNFITVFDLFPDNAQVRLSQGIRLIRLYPVKPAALGDERRMEQKKELVAKLLLF
jgi:hypothetical protein